MSNNENSVIEKIWQLCQGVLYNLERDMEGIEEG